MLSEITVKNYFSFRFYIRATPTVQRSDFLIIKSRNYSFRVEPTSYHSLIVISETKPFKQDKL